MNRSTNRILMDKELKSKWIAALRSGEYKQGTAALYHHGAYCCIGVLACVKNESRGNDACYAWDKIGHPYEYGGIGPKADVLVDMNDSGISFDKIADYIEANL